MAEEEFEKTIIGEGITPRIEGLTTDEVDELLAYRTVYNALFTDKKIPSVLELQKKAKEDTLTIRDAIASRFYVQGIIHDDIKSFDNFPKEDIAKIKEIYAVFPDASKGKGKALRTVTGHADVINKFNNFLKKHRSFDNLRFDTLMSDVEGSILELKQLNKTLPKKDKIPNITWLESGFIKPFRKVDGIKEKLLSGDIFQETEGAGSRIFTGDIPCKEVIGIILRGISRIEDPELKNAAILGLFGQRAEALMNMKKDPISASKFKGKIRPWYDINTGIIHNPTDMPSIIEIGGRKRLPPSSQVGPLLRQVLAQQHFISKGKEEMFPNLRATNLTNIINNVVHNSGGISNYPPELVKTLGRKLSGFTDFRRLFASIMINEVADQTTDPTKKKELYKLANKMLGHGTTKKMTLDEIDDLQYKVLTDHYAILKDSKTKIADNKIPILMETFMADAMNAVDDRGQLKSNRLAAILNIDVPENFGHIYTNTIEGEIIQETPNVIERNETVQLKSDTKKLIETTNTKNIQKQILGNINETIEVTQGIEEGAVKLEEKGWVVDRATGKMIPPEKEITLTDKQQSLYDKYINPTPKEIEEQDIQEQLAKTGTREEQTIARLAGKLGVSIEQATDIVKNNKTKYLTKDQIKKVSPSLRKTYGLKDYKNAASQEDLNKMAKGLGIKFKKNVDPNKLDEKMRKKLIGKLGGIGKVLFLWSIFTGFKRAKFIKEEVPVEMFEPRLTEEGKMPFADQMFDVFGEGATSKKKWRVAYEKYAGFIPWSQHLPPDVAFGTGMEEEHYEEVLEEGFAKEVEGGPFGS